MLRLELTAWDRNKKTVWIIYRQYPSACVRTKLQDCHFKAIYYHIICQKQRTCFKPDRTSAYKALTHTDASEVSHIHGPLNKQEPWGSLLLYASASMECVIYVLCKFEALNWDIIAQLSSLKLHAPSVLRLTIADSVSLYPLIIYENL